MRSKKSGGNIMIEDKLAIILYTSTKGHFGYKNCYKHTVKRMQSVIPFFDEYTKISHIKYSENEEKQLSEMKSFLNENGFEVICSKGDWSHGNNSHANGYYKDMLTALSTSAVHKYNYVLKIEDDWLLNFNNSYTQAVSKAISFLEEDLNALCVRINHDINDDLSKANEKVSGYIYQQGLNYTEYGPTFTFQPTIVKLKEWYHSVRLINKQIDKDPSLLNKIHCEIISGQTLKLFSDYKSPFFFFNPKIINAKHIGQEDEIKKLKQYDIL